MTFYQPLLVQKIIQWWYMYESILGLCFCNLYLDKILYLHFWSSAHPGGWPGPLMLKLALTYPMAFDLLYLHLWILMPLSTALMNMGERKGGAAGKAKDATGRGCSEGKLCNQFRGGWARGAAFLLLFSGLKLQKETTRSCWGNVVCYLMTGCG